MLSNTEYLAKFNRMQAPTIAITKSIAKTIRPGMTELEVAESYQDKLAEAGLGTHWYPILIYVGELTGKPISRRFHLPSADVVIHENDIIMLDSTPIDGTTWSNWAETFVIGHDEFYEKLIHDAQSVVDKTYDFATTEAKTIGDILDFCLTAMQKLDLVNLDSRNDVGHSIFQVPEGQTVDQTPLSERLFMNEDYRDHAIEGILSIEPQAGRINPVDGKMYGAKIQKVIMPDREVFE